MNITRTAFAEMLLALTGPQRVAFTQESRPDMNKKGNPYLTAMKRQTIEGVIGFNYEDLMTAEFPEYGKYTAQQRVWGLHVSDSPLVEHKGELYLPTIVEKTLKGPEYFIGNQIIDPRMIEPYLKDKAAEPLVRPRDFKISGIRWFRNQAGDECFIA